MMALLDLIVGPVMDIVNKLIPDPAQKAQAQLALLQLQQNDQFKEIDAQLAQSAQQTDTNKVEAANVNIFVSGWRPFVGWVCGCGFGYQFLFSPLLGYVSAIFHGPIPPSIDVSALSTMLTGMLGFGAMRTYEKVKGINSGN